jgi:hypothetical protein
MTLTAIRPDWDSIFFEEEAVVVVQPEDYMIFLHVHLLGLPAGVAAAVQVRWTAVENNFSIGYLFCLA